MRLAAAAIAGADRYLRMRRHLVSTIYGTASLPPDIPSMLADQAVGMAYYDLAASTDVLSMVLPRGGFATAHVNHPDAWNRRITLVHGGHGSAHYLSGAEAWGLGELSTARVAAGDIVIGVPFWAQFPTEGPVPLTLTNGSTTTIEGFGDASVLEADGAHPLWFFLGAYIQAVNYAVTLDPSEIVAIGFSGGGQMTDLLGAIDKRVKRSINIMGSVPESFRVTSGGPCTDGNWEYRPIRSWMTALAEKAVIPGEDQFLNLYLLGCREVGRQRIQYLGDEDGESPVLTLHTEVSAYQAIVDSHVPAGQHTIKIDETPAEAPANGHYVSPWIVADIGTKLL